MGRLSVRQVSLPSAAILTMELRIVAVALAAAVLCPSASIAEEYFRGSPNSGWWHTAIKYDEPDTRPVWFGGTLRCENAFPPVGGTQEQEFGVSVVLKYEGGGEDWSPFAKWDVGTHDW